MARLFMRLFAGVMFLQLGLRQIMHFDEVCQACAALMPGTCIDIPTMISVVIIVEIVCSTLWMLGLLFRFSLILPLIAMLALEVALHGTHPASLAVLIQPGSPAMMMIGIFIFMLLAGPGKISLDYVISSHLLSREEAQISDDEREINEA